MKISVLALSRGRPFGLIATLEAFRRLASGQHDIGWNIRVDDDDLETRDVFGRWGWAADKDTYVHYGPRPTTLGEAINELAADDDWWEILQVIPDDIMPVTSGWDHALVQSAAVNASASWRELNDPTNPTLPYITRRWYTAVGRAFPEYFTFWWSDTWIAEVFSLAYDRPMPIITQLSFAGERPRTVTTNMREVAFWNDLFARTRRVRLAEAARICEAESRPFLPNPQWTTMFEQGDRHRALHASEWEARWGDKREPSAAYIEAQRRAEEWLSANP